MRWRIKATDLSILAVISLLLVAILYRPLRWMVLVWLSDPFYSHGFLVPLVAAILVWRLQDRLVSLPTRPAAWGGVFFALSLVLAVLAVWWQAYFVANLLLLVLIAALMLYFKGWAALRIVLFPIAYLSLMIPLPFVSSLAPRLQLWTSTFAAMLAGLLAVPVQQQGTAISIPDAAYVVGVACSGLSSIIALTAVGTLIVYLVKGQPLARTALIAAIVPIAIVANGLRVGSLLWVAYRFGSEAGLTYHNTIAGFLFWALAIAFLLLGSRLLRCQLNLVASP